MEMYSITAFCLESHLLKTFHGEPSIKLYILAQRREDEIPPTLSEILGSVTFASWGLALDPTSLEISAGIGAVSQ